MTSMSDDPLREKSPPDTAIKAPLRIPITSHPLEIQSPTASLQSLPFRSSTTSQLFATTTPPTSRPLSPSGSVTSARTQPGIFRSSTPTDRAGSGGFANELEDPRVLITRAFVPHIVVASSQDTEELIAEKGFSQGFWQLLRPFGDHVTGKVQIRDSVGASKVCEDFAVRFTKLGDGVEQPAQNDLLQLDQDAAQQSVSRLGGDLTAIESVVDRHLDYAEQFGQQPNGEMDAELNLAESNGVSPFYLLYLRKLLSGMPLIPAETFSHPVACVIAISSRSQNPIEELRRLYEEATRGPKRFPSWVNGEYLRYYVLVHDEERDDIGKSMSLFEQMKRHFGLHCHLLRIRSSRCVPTDDDSILLPSSDWMSAGEELADIASKEDQDDLEDNSPCIFDSDATAINTFIREMVTQSIVPSMERCVATWNDQVASRRRGISGRFMTLSKKWTVFGSSSRGLTGGSNGTGTGNNYDSTTESYPPEAPEAIMRKLADYAFMLRDYKLAQSVYELLRADFNNDKAWKYHAAVNEMSVITMLVASQAMSFKIRIDTVDQLIEAASYSYITRCGASYGALRCLALSAELLKIRGGSATDDAARWTLKILETGILGPIGDALFKERVAACYGAKKGSGSGHWGARPRKSALWNLLASDRWVGEEKYAQAAKRLTTVRILYSSLPCGSGISKFEIAQNFVDALEQELKMATSDGEDGGESQAEEEQIDVESEALGVDVRSHRKSLIGSAIPTIESLETAPLHVVEELKGSTGARDSDFQ